MKKKIAILSAFLAGSSFSFSEIVINDWLSFEGFIDMSYVHSESETLFEGDESENSYSIDQVEISWLFDFDKVTAQIDFEYDEDGDDGEGSQEEVEQAFVTYHFDDGMRAITAGRYASMLGFEAFEPTGLYQYSFAYAGFIPNEGFGLEFGSDASILPSYSQGVKYTYETDTSFVGVSLQDSSWGYDSDRFGGDGDSSYGFEVAAALTPGDGFTYFLGFAYESADVEIAADDDRDTYLINGYVVYETGDWIFAAELNWGSTESSSFLVDVDPTWEIDAFSGLIMANYSYSEQASVTGRISFADFEKDDGEGFVLGPDDDLDLTFWKFTVAHNYAFTDNLLLVAELSYIDGDVSSDVPFPGLEDPEELFGALELLFTF